MAKRPSSLRTASVTTRKFFQLIDSSDLSETELSRISGIHPNTFYGWKSGKASATVFNLEAALSVLGYELVIKRIKIEPGNIP